MDILFTDYDKVFEYDYLADLMKQAVSKLKGFDSLTIDLLVRNENDYSGYGGIIDSYRFTNKHNECKKSHFNGESYRIWNETTTKEIYPTLKDIVVQANRKFVELLKEINAPALT